jgi:aryl sulfotransferase
VIEGGYDSFLHRGTNNRWKGMLTDADLADYEERIKLELSPALSEWLRGGRLVAGDPESASD